MKIARTIRWGFDPRATAGEPHHPVLATDLGRLVFAAIRHRHIVDQHFHDNCLAFVESIRESMPADAVALYRRACEHYLNGFGMAIVGFDEPAGRPDMEWWQDLFDLVTGKEKIEMVYPDPASSVESVKSVDESHV